MRGRTAVYLERADALTPQDILQELQGCSSQAIATDRLPCERQRAPLSARARYQLGRLLSGPRRGAGVGSVPGQARMYADSSAKGVCGTSIARDDTLVVADVEAFPGSHRLRRASRSEIVVPLRVRGRVVGVLDCDSPGARPVPPAERALFEEAARLVGAGSGSPQAALARAP